MDKNEGLREKFAVERLTPSSRGIDHSECRYFVLDPQHDPNALFALTHYGHNARKAGNEKLADDIEEWVREISRERHVH